MALQTQSSSANARTGGASVSCRAHGRLVARASRPFAPNQKLPGGTPVPLTLQETEKRPGLGTHQAGGCVRRSGRSGLVVYFINTHTFVAPNLAREIGRASCRERVLVAGGPISV